MKEQQFVHPDSQLWRGALPSQVGAYFAWTLFLGGVGCLLKLPPISPWFIPPGILCIAGGVVLGWRHRRCLWLADRREDLRKLYGGQS
jgi:hypothetical protein